MDFTAEVSKLTAHFSRVTNHLETVYQGERAERAAIDVLVKPFLTMMGYSVFDVTEVAPEYPVNPGGGQQSKVDLAIMQDGKPAILIECKSYTNRELKQKDIRQLSEYFGHVETAQFGILTNGITYRFFTDREERHIMDSTPFFEFDFFGYTDPKINQLKSFTKANLNQTAAEKEAVRRNEILLSEDEIHKCREFIGKESHMEGCERKRTLYMGKLGEVAFAKFLLAKGKEITRLDYRGQVVCTDDMFTDWINYLLPDGYSVDTKATSDPNHSAILVEKNRYVFDCYVGLHPLDHSDKRWSVAGYCTRNEMGAFGLHKQRDGNLAYRPPYICSGQ